MEQKTVDGDGGVVDGFPGVFLFEHVAYLTAIAVNAVADAVEETVGFSVHGNKG